MSTVLIPKTIERLLAEKSLLLVDKPQGVTSHDVVNTIRRETETQKVGHAGTLDPMATGLLIVLVGREATRHQDKLMGMDKEYLFTAEFGRETDTYDDSGEIIQTWPWEEVREVTQEKIEAALDRFRGEYIQKVPPYSAIKLNGRRLYDMARKYQNIDLPSRPVRIIELELTNFSKNEVEQKISFSCRVLCGSGTYVRSLAVDIGFAVDVGATITSLRRTKIGNFTLS